MINSYKIIICFALSGNFSDSYSHKYEFVVEMPRHEDEPYHRANVQVTFPQNKSNFAQVSLKSFKTFLVVFLRKLRFLFFIIIIDMINPIYVLFRNFQFI